MNNPLCSAKICLDDTVQLKDFGKLCSSRLVEEQPIKNSISDVFDLPLCKEG